VEYQHNVHHHKKSLVAAGILSALIAGNVAMAADVPAGVQLAEKQTLVRNNGSEVQSLDPHKIEGVPESNVSRDLFEGLLVQTLKAIRARVSLKSGKTKTLKSGPSICVKMRNGPMVRRLRHTTSFIAGSVWQIQKLHPHTPATCNMVTLRISMTSSPVKNQPQTWA
jgi:hypothetical protein